MLADRLSGPDPGPLRDAVLRCALHAFSERDFDTVDLAALAGEAGATEAFVFHCFGTKEGLFAAAIDKAFSAVSGSLSIDALERPDPTEVAPFAWPIDLLMLILRSARDPRIAGILREHVERRLHGPLAAALTGPDTGQRAALYVALMAGIQLMQGILGGPGRGRDGLRPPADRMAALLQVLLDVPGDAGDASRGETARGSGLTRE